MNHKSARLLWPLLIATAACGSESETDGAGAVGGPDGPGPNAGGPPSVPAPGGPGAGGPGDPLIEDDGTLPEPDPDVDPSECAEESQEATIPAVQLLFLLDESGSMGDGENGQPEQKWDPVSTALKAFFADASSQGLEASLTVFPPNLNTGTGAADAQLADDAVCESSSYADPLVPLTPLPQVEMFGAAIEEVTPPNEWGTPTQPALEGMIEQAEQLLAADPTAKVVIVMVTDGEPIACAGSNSIGGTADLAESIAMQVPTYVVGVGDSLQNLNRIAEAGGTEEAFIVPIDDPASTQQLLIDTFNEIKTDVISCDAPIPPPPAGRAFEKEKVAVEMTLSDGAVTDVGYSQDCAAGTGWHYDDPVTPTMIQLCDASCDILQSQQSAGLTVVFACKPLIEPAK